MGLVTIVMARLLGSDQEKLAAEQKEDLDLALRAFSDNVGTHVRVSEEHLSM